MLSCIEQRETGVRAETYNEMLLLVAGATRHGSGGGIRQAATILLRMKTAGIDPDSETYAGESICGHMFVHPQILIRHMFIQPLVGGCRTGS